MTKKDPEINYIWNTWINDRAIIEFRKSNNISTILKLNHYYLLAKLVGIYLQSNSKIEDNEINGKRHIYVSNSLIKENLRLWNIQERQLINIYDLLVENNFIETVVIGNNKKYIYINNQLLSLWNGETVNAKQLSKKVRDLGKIIGTYFSKTEEHQLKEVYIYLSGIKDLDYFESQFIDYKVYKEYSNDKVHSFKNYCQEWNECNWKLKLGKAKMITLKKDFDN